MARYRADEFVPYFCTINVLDWLPVLIEATPRAFEVGLLAGFVGLMVPHLIRRLTGPRLLAILPACVAGGAAFLTACELLARGLSDRFALTFKVDGGAGPVTPDPRLFANDDGAGAGAVAPTIGGGVGFAYVTLLNDFSVGVDARFSMTLLSGASIPGLSATIPIKYTF